LNKEWLSGHERILIEILKGDINTLKNPILYKKYLLLRDTVTPESPELPPPLYDPHHHAMPPYDNLSPFLWQNFQVKLNLLKSRHPQEELLWDFLDIVFDYANTKVVQYLVNFPDSPYANLVRYNYLVRYTYQHQGIIGGIGASRLNFDKSTNAFFRDRIGAYGFVDLFLRDFMLGLSCNISNARSADSIIAGEDTIPASTPFQGICFNLSAGRILSVHDLVYITPHIGAGGFSTFPYYTRPISFPIAWGARIGISTDVRIAFYDTRFITDTPRPDLGVRVDIGYQYNKFYRILDHLGKHVFYFTIALELISFRSKRIYDVD